MSSVRLLDVFPDRALTQPGAPVLINIDIRNDGADTTVSLEAELREGGRTVARRSCSPSLVPGVQRHTIEMPTPELDCRGYEAVIALKSAASNSVMTSAVLVASHWRHAPRYGFVSEFPPENSREEQIEELAKFHVNVVQFYDWMYRHFEFLPKEDRFKDAMGRDLSFATVRRRIAACHRHGMAALAYGAVYGAEPEFVERHPEWVLRNAAGEKLSLIDLFYITDLRPGAPWREHILDEFQGAVQQVGFDGIHMDQYGFPKWSYDYEGTSVNLAEHFSGLIDEAAARASEQRDGAAVLFNAVNNWPIERIAESNQAAVYIEVWPPHDDYRDLLNLIRRARDLSGKQVILAAYLEPFREVGEGAEQSALLATAVIAAAGGFHLLLGEGNAVLRDPYYPNHGHMSPEFAVIMRRYYDHTAANHHFLFNDDFQDVTTSFATGINEELVMFGAPVCTSPISGSVWMNVKQRGSQFIVNLVNLTGLSDSRWNVAKEKSPVVEGLTLTLSSHFDVERVVWSSPDEELPARELTRSKTDGKTAIPLPGLQVWATLAIELR